MKFKDFVAGSLLAGLSFAAALGTASAQTGKKGIFTIHNDTSGNVVVGFYTNDGTGWSRNWLRSQLKPGEDAQAEFIEDGALCKQRIRVGWLSKNGGEVLDDPINIDFCKATNVYLKDNDVTYD